MRQGKITRTKGRVTVYAQRSEKYSDVLFTKTGDNAATGLEIDTTKAELIIEVLQKYIKGHND